MTRTYSNKGQRGWRRIMILLLTLLPFIPTDMMAMPDNRLGSANEDFAAMKEEINRIKDDTTYISTEKTSSPVRQANKLCIEELRWMISLEYQLDQLPEKQFWRFVRIFNHPRGNAVRSFACISRKDLDSIGIPRREGEDGNSFYPMTGMSDNSNGAIATGDIDTNGSVAHTASTFTLPALTDMLIYLLTVEMINEATLKLDEEKAKGTIEAHGQVHSMADVPKEGYLLMFNDKRQIVGLLEVTDNELRNLSNNQPATFADYKGCLGYWFY